MWRNITEEEKKQFNTLATHPLQAYEWGEFRKQTGIKVIRKGFFQNNKFTQVFQLTIHPIPHTKWNVGYLPKGILPTNELLDELYKIGKEEMCIFIQLEPNVLSDQSSLSTKQLKKMSLMRAAHPLFTKYTLHIDLTKSEEALLSAMHPKARYNIKVAQKHNVTVKEDNTTQAFATYWRLTQETTSRQQFFAHTQKYHTSQWQILPHSAESNTLSSHLLLAKYKDQPLTAWILFIFKDMLYYPYGASSSEYREVMHSTLMMWEAMRFGKKHNLKTFDLWGAAAPNTPASDPWFGFTQFKERFGPKRVEFIGSYDLVIHPVLYRMYIVADKLRWLLLRFR